MMLALTAVEKDGAGTIDVVQASQSMEAFTAYVNGMTVTRVEPDLEAALCRLHKMFLCSPELQSVLHAEPLQSRGASLTVPQRNGKARSKNQPDQLKHSGPGDVRDIVADIVQVAWVEQPFDGSRYEHGLSPEQRCQEIASIMASLAHRVVAADVAAQEQEKEVLKKLPERNVRPIRDQRVH